MPSIAELLSIALAHHQAGRLEEAETAYRRILEVEPQNVATWHLLGRLKDRTGRPDEAVACFRQALNIWPEYAEAHSDHGTVLEAQGRLEEAAAAYSRAVELKPAYAEAHFNLGNVLREQGDRPGALASYRRALAINAALAPAHLNLASLFSDEGQFEEAIGHFRQALRLTPDCPRALFGLGLALQQQGDRHEAADCYRHVLELEADNVEAHYNMGLLLAEKGEGTEAAEHFRRAIELRPGNADWHNELGAALELEGWLDEAIACFRQALELRPGFMEAHNNLGVAYYRQGQFKEADECYRRASEIEPEAAEVRFNAACLKLLQGEFARGWQEYEWRWKRKECPKRIFEQPLWDGQDLSGKTILLHAEQGFGDTIQFIRYATMVKARGARVIVECQRPLLRLLAACAGIDQWVGEGNALPAFDLHVALASLPRIFGTNAENVPVPIPYLSADATLVAEWRERLSQAKGFRIGINWHGRVGKRESRQRDVPVEMFERLASVADTRLISLQKAVREAGTARPTPRLPVAALDLGNFDTEHGAFVDTAAVMMNLDLVISSDTAVPHVAGALGMPVWVALPFVPDWRWMLDRNDSPWYPTMRLFRQQQPGNWEGVFAEIEEALSERIQSSKFKVQG